MKFIADQNLLGSDHFFFVSRKRFVDKNNPVDLTQYQWGDNYKKIALNNFLGSVVLLKNGTKVLFQDTPQEEVLDLFKSQNIAAGDLSYTNQSKDLFIGYHSPVESNEIGHAYVIIQNNGNDRHFYQFDFVSRSHADGGWGGYLSPIIPDNCAISNSQENLPTKQYSIEYLPIYKIMNQYTFLPEVIRYFNKTEPFYLAKPFFHTLKDHLLHFKIDDSQFELILQNMKHIGGKCASGEMQYSMNNILFDNVKNCISGVDLLLKLSGIENSLHYFFDSQILEKDNIFNHYSYAIKHDLGLLQTVKNWWQYSTTSDDGIKNDTYTPYTPCYKDPEQNCLKEDDAQVHEDCIGIEALEGVL
jgi:hypothetical protein